MSGGEEEDGYLFSWFSLSHCFIFKNYEFKVCLHDSPRINPIFSLIFFLAFREGNHTMLQIQDQDTTRMIMVVPTQMSFYSK